MYPDETELWFYLKDESVEEAFIQAFLEYNESRGTRKQAEEYMEKWPCPSRVSIHKETPYEYRFIMLMVWGLSFSKDKAFHHLHFDFGEFMQGKPFVMEK